MSEKNRLGDLLITEDFFSAKRNKMIVIKDDIRHWEKFPWLFIGVMFVMAVVYPISMIPKFDFSWSVILFTVFIEFFLVGTSIYCIKKYRTAIFFKHQLESNPALQEQNRLLDEMFFFNEAAVFLGREPFIPTSFELYAEFERKRNELLTRHAALFGNGGVK